MSLPLPTDTGPAGPAAPPTGLPPTPRLPGRFRAAVRFPLRAAGWVRRHPRPALLTAVVLVGGAAFGVWRYALYQWGAAEAALRQDRPREARDRLGLCLRVWPRSPAVHLRAARAERQLGDLPAAEAHLNRCLELQGPTDDVRLEFLLMRVQAGEVEDENAPPVSALFQAVQDGHPEAPMILETIARTYLLRLRYRPAYECLSYWVEIDPRNPKPYYWRGWTLERINQPKAAKLDYDRALELDPDMVPPRLAVVEMLLQDKQAPDALGHLERLMRLAPDDPRVRARTGMCLFLQGRGPEARRLMEGAVPDLPDDPALLLTLANLDLQDGRGEDAERRARAVLANDPTDTEALFVLASALRLQNRTAEAAAVLAEHEKKQALVDRINALLKDVADSPTAKPDDFAELGRFFFRIGRDKLGVYWAERALERDPQNQNANGALAAYYEAKGEAARAAAYRRQLRPAAPAVPPAPKPGEKAP